MILILALAMVNRPSDLNLLRITPRALQVNPEWITFQPVFGTKKIPAYPLVWASENAETVHKPFKGVLNQNKRLSSMK